jgi:Nucleoside 2-deoxyribosyltransferase
VVGQRIKGTRSAAPLLYVASSLGFAEGGRHFYYDRLLPLVARLGWRPIDPWALTDDAVAARVRSLRPGPARLAAWRRLNARIGETNRRAIDRADAVLAVLDGADVDSGTAAEIGFACASGTPVVGYRGDDRPAGDNEGAVVNLQVEYFIRASGGSIVTTMAALGPALARVRPGRRRAAPP